MITGRIPGYGITSLVGNDMALHFEKGTETNWLVYQISRCKSVLPLCKTDFFVGEILWKH
jgi:hypothetical protein